MRHPSATATVRPSVESLEPRRLLAAIASDQTLSGSIAVVGEADEFTFNAAAGDSIVVALTDTDSTSATAPRLEIFAPDGTSLGAEADFDGVDLDVTAPQNGTYRAVVRENGDDNTFDYRITLAKLPGPQTPGVDGGPILSGQRLEGQIVRGDLDVFTFQADAGDSVVFALTDLDSASSTAPFLRIYGPDGAVVASESDFDGVDLDFTAPSGGTYYALVRESNSDNAMDYRVALSVFPGPQADDVLDNDGGTLVSGGRVAGQIDRGDLDAFTFTADPGDSVVVTLADLDSATSTVPFLRIYGPDGAVVASESDFDAVDLDFIAPSGGTYYALVREANSDAAMDYRIGLAVFPGPQADDPFDNDGGVIVSGQRVEGRVDRGDLDIYTFTADPGDNVVAALTDLDSTTSTVPFLRIYGPDGAVVASESDFDGVDLDFIAPSGGTYYALVREGNVDAAMDYRLALAVLPGPQAADDFDDEGGPIASGQTLAGRIDRGDLDIYTFAADPGDQIAVALGDTDATTATAVRLSLYAPDGTRIADGADFDGTEQFVIAPTGGTYYVVARESNSDAALDYQLSLVVVPGPQASDPFDLDGGNLPSGQDRTGSITRADLDVFTFNASAGNAFTVNLLETTGNSAFGARVTVFGPDGALLGSNTANPTTSVNVASAPASGTYYALVRDADSDATGTYSIGLNAPAGSDADPPQVAGARFVFEREQAIEFVLSEPINGLSFRDFEVLNTTTGAGFAPTVDFVAATNTVRLTFPALSGDVLPDGNYRVTLEAGSVADAAGNVFGGAFVFDTFSLAGDANRDRAVTIADFALLRAGFGGPGVFSDGDFNYDGQVTIADFAILRSNFGTSLASPAASLFADGDGEDVLG